jgi:hypothetical protein
MSDLGIQSTLSSFDFTDFPIHHMVLDSSLILGPIPFRLFGKRDALLVSDKESLPSNALGDYCGVLNIQTPPLHASLFCQRLSTRALLSPLMRSKH